MLSATSRTGQTGTYLQTPWLSWMAPADLENESKGTRILTDPSEERGAKRVGTNYWYQVTASDY